MSQFTATFIKDCALCFHTKTLCSAPLGFLKPLELSVHLWTDIFIDYVIDLPKCLCNSKTYRYIFVVINHLTKMRHFILIISLDTEELVKAFTHTIYKLYSALSTIVFNRDSLFISNLWHCLN